MLHSLRCLHAPSDRRKQGATQLSEVTTPHVREHMPMPLYKKIELYRKGTISDVLMHETDNDGHAADGDGE